MAMGACWAAGSWAATAWVDGSWSGPGVIAVEFGDLTTLFSAYVVDLRDASVMVELDSTTLVAADLPTVIAGSASEDDLNTAYAEYLSV